MKRIIIIWTTQAISIITSAISSWALIWYVTQESGSAMLLSIISICALLPQGILAPLGGAFADKHGKKITIIISDSGEGAVSLLLALLFLVGSQKMHYIIFFCIIRSIVSAFHAPAMRAFMPSIVPPQYLLRINTLDQILEGTASIISPALGILLYSVLGFHFVMIIEFVGALVAVCGLITVKTDKEKNIEQRNRSLPKILLVGWNSIKTNRGLRHILIALALGLMLFGPISTLSPLMTYNYFHGDGAMVSLLEGVFGIGTIIGSAIIILKSKKIKKYATLACISAIWMGVFTAICGVLPDTKFPCFVFFIGVVAFGCPFFNGPITTIMQTNVPKSSIGSVMGFISAITCLSSPIGILVGGILADYFGIPIIFLVNGICIAGIGVLCIISKDVIKMDSIKDGETS